MRGGRVHAPPHWLQAVPPLTAKLNFPAQIRRGQVLNVLNLATKLDLLFEKGMRRFLEGRISLVSRLLANDPEVAYADLMLILTAVLSACAAVRWPISQKGEGIDKVRFVELLVTASPQDARAGYVSVPALVRSGLVSEAQTPWNEPGRSTRIYKGEETDCAFDSAVIAFPAVTKKDLKRHSYACLIYEWIRCGYAHEYCVSDWVTEVPPSRKHAQVSYIGRADRHLGIVRMAHFHLDYLIDLAVHHVRTLPDHALVRPTEWWLKVT